MSILITERAKSEINRIVEEQKNDNNNDKKQYLRVRVVGGGCSGFQYKLTMDEEINEKLDELYEINEVSVIIDKRSMMYINGATIDYLDDMNERGFKVVNPIAKSTCGCGSSFNL
jgi:iron-sulfur cluster insertion protein